MCLRLPVGSRRALASCGQAAVFILKPLQSRSAGPAGWFLPVAGSVSFPPLFSAPQSTLNDIEQLRQASTGSTASGPLSVVEEIVDTVIYPSRSSFGS